MPVNCARCNTEIPVIEAWRCCCGDAFFCSEEHFNQDPHSKIEDDKHAEANELIQANIDVKFSRIVGKGGYVGLIDRLVDVIVNPSSVPRVKSGLIKDFADESTKSNRGPVTNYITAALTALETQNKNDFKDSLTGLELIWKKDSPRSVKQIEAAMTQFLDQFDKFPGPPDQGIKLRQAGFTLGNALNGSRK